MPRRRINFHGVSEKVFRAGMQRVNGILVSAPKERAIVALSHRWLHSRNREKSLFIKTNVTILVSHQQNKISYFFFFFFQYFFLPRTSITWPDFEHHKKRTMLPSFKYSLKIFFFFSFYFHGATTVGLESDSDFRKRALLPFVKFVRDDLNSIETL